jgi:hypothetical protein
VTVKVSDKGVIVLEVPGLAEKRPSVIVGDFIKIRVSGDHTAYKGYVYRVNDKTVEITHVDEDFLEYLQEYPETELDVAFMLSRLAFERMHRGVDRVVDTGMVATLFPSGRRELPTSNTFTLRDVEYYLPITVVFVLTFAVVVCLIKRSPTILNRRKPSRRFSTLLTTCLT